MGWQGARRGEGLVIEPGARASGPGDGRLNGVDMADDTQTRARPPRLRRSATAPGTAGSPATFGSSRSRRQAPAPAPGARSSRATPARSSTGSSRSPTGHDVEAEAASRARPDGTSVRGARLLLVQRSPAPRRPVRRPRHRSKRSPRPEHRGVRVRAALPEQAAPPIAERRDRVSTRTLPRHARGLGGYCWTEHPNGGRHCTLPVGHTGSHWHTYSRTSW